MRFTHQSASYDMPHTRYRDRVTNFVYHATHAGATIGTKFRRSARAIQLDSMGYSKNYLEYVYHPQTNTLQNFTKRRYTRNL